MIKLLTIGNSPYVSLDGEKGELGMKRSGNELWAILAGMVTAYVFQLTMATLVWLNNSDSKFSLTVFVPMWTIQLTIMPVASWFYMGLFGVRWQKRWNSITRKTAAFLIPFIIISLLMLFLLPIAMEFWQFWVADILLSIVAGLTVGHKLLTNPQDKGRRK